MPQVSSRFGLDRFELREDFILAASATPILPWVSTDSGDGAGSPTLDFVNDTANGIFRLATDSQSEAQRLAMSWGDQLVIDPTKNPVFEARIRLNVATDPWSADQRLVCGLASARANDLDTVTSNVWFRYEGNNNNVLIEGDDGTTDTDDTDSTLDWSDNVFHTLTIDMADTAAVRFLVDGIEASSTVDVSQLSSSELLQPFIEIQRDAGTEAETLDIDYVYVAWNR